MERRTIDCAEIERRLEKLGAGGSDALSGAARNHLAGCPDCRELLELASIAERATAPDAELTRRILESTSGSACAAVESWLVAASAEEKAGGGEDLYDADLAACDDCLALRRALEAMDRDLPAMAEVSPGIGFVEGVLAATLPSTAPRLGGRRSLWSRLVARPLFAAEAAFAATLVLALLTVSLPGAGALGGATPSARAVDTGKLLDRGWSRAGRLVERGPRLLARGGDQLRTFWSDVASLLENEPSAAPNAPNPAAPARTAPRPDSEETT